MGWNIRSWWPPTRNQLADPYARQKTRPHSPPRPLVERTLGREPAPAPPCTIVFLCRTLNATGAIGPWTGRRGRREQP
eukprot:1107558-Amphidinium_carterae.1